MLSPKHPSGMTGAGIILTLMLPVTDVAANNRADVTLSATVVPVCELWINKVVVDLGTIPADQFSGRAENAPFISTGWLSHQVHFQVRCHSTGKYTITASSPNQPSFDGSNLLSDHPGNKMAFQFAGFSWFFNDPDSLSVVASSSAPDVENDYYFYALPTGSPGGVIPSPGQHTVSLTLTIEPA
ncbi:Uncharacterised protein [Klebsiella variicola]|nr:Uncharacterised protein [Klebsiella variicola]VAR92473.1 Uncharacterised protein [Klebsiella variicola]